MSIQNNYLTEVKIMQRHQDCDINAMMFYAFYTAKFTEIKKIWDKKFDRNFIGNCFFCGCRTVTSGKKISNYIIQNASFLAFYQKVKNELSISGNSTEKEVYHRVYLSIKILHDAILNCKSNYENILLFDEKNNKIKNILDKNYPMKLLGPFFRLDEQEVLRITNSPDNLPALYDALKKWLKNDNFMIYYTLYDNTLPTVSIYIKNKLKFCMKNDHSQNGCYTNSFVKRVIYKKTNADRRFNELYDFVGLREKINADMDFAVKKFKIVFPFRGKR